MKTTGQDGEEKRSFRGRVGRRFVCPLADSDFLLATNKVRVTETGDSVVYQDNVTAVVFSVCFFSSSFFATGSMFLFLSVNAFTDRNSKCDSVLAPNPLSPTVNPLETISASHHFNHHISRVPADVVRSIKILVIT